jgi:hypothetical protein
MGQLISEARSDLAQLGVSEPQIELHAFDELISFAERGLPSFLCDIYGEIHEPTPASLLAALPGKQQACLRRSPASLLAALPPHEDARTGCLLAADAEPAIGASDEIGDDMIAERGIVLTS